MREAFSERGLRRLETESISQKIGDDNSIGLIGIGLLARRRRKVGGEIFGKTPAHDHVELVGLDEVGTD